MEEVLKIKNSFDNTRFNENSIQALYNYISSAIGGDALEVINSGNKSPVDDKRKAELREQKIGKIVERVYPEYPSKVSEVDVLFFIFTDVLQRSDRENTVALGKLLQYTDLVFNNRNVNQNRSLATYLLRNVDSKGSNPINFKKGMVTTCKEMDKFRSRSIKVTKKQVSFANKYKYATNFYLSNCKVEVDLIKDILDLLKRAGHIEGISDKEVKKGIAEIITKHRKGKDSEKSILVDFMNCCSPEFVRYFSKHEKLSDNPTWFGEEYTKSEAEFDKVFGHKNEGYDVSNYRYNFNFMILFDCLYDHPFSDKQLKEINYDNLNQKLNRR